MMENLSCRSPYPRVKSIYGPYTESAEARLSRVSSSLGIYPEIRPEHVAACRVSTSDHALNSPIANPPAEIVIHDLDDMDVDTIPPRRNPSTGHIARDMEPDSRLMPGHLGMSLEAWPANDSTLVAEDNESIYIFDQVNHKLLQRVDHGSGTILVLLIWLH
jgi:hypothetical protein